MTTNRLDQAIGDSLYAAAMAEVAFTMLAEQIPANTVRTIISTVLTILDDEELTASTPKTALRRAKGRAEVLLERYTPAN